MHVEQDHWVPSSCLVLLCLLLPFPLLFRISMRGADERGCGDADVSGGGGGDSGGLGLLPRFFTLGSSYCNEHRRLRSFQGYLKLQAYGY